MPLFGRSKPQGRGELLEAAAKARSRRRYRRAIGLYREVLDRDPGDAAVEGRLAGCLALEGAREESWVRYRSAAARFASQGFVDKAAALLRDASGFFPREPEVWTRMARLHLERQRKAEAVAILLEGRRHFRGRRDLEIAERLLMAAFELDPRRIPTGLELARVLARSGRKDEARRLLEALLERATTPRDRRRVRGRQLRLSPTPAALWRWLVKP